MAVRIGVIAVGGTGARFGRSDMQKCLIPLDTKPVMEYMIDAFVATGIKLIFVVTGFLHEQVSAYLASRHQDGNCVLAVVYGGTEGQAQAILALQPFLHDQDFIYAPGDCVFAPQTIRRLIKDAQRRKNHIAVASVAAETSYAPEHPGFKVHGRTGLVREVTKHLLSPRLIL